MSHRPGMVLLGAILALGAAAEAAAPPGKGRGLNKQELQEVEALEARFARHLRLGEFEEMARVRQRLAEYRRARQGARHRETLDEHFASGYWGLLARVPRRDRDEFLRSLRLKNEGMARLDRGRPNEAEKPLREALAILQRLLGKDHPHSALGCNDLANCLRAGGKSEEALALLRQALRACEASLGEEHPYTAGSHNNVGTCLQDLGKTAEALRPLRRSVEIFEKVLGADHPSTAGSYNSLARCLQESGKPADALAMYRSALRIREAAHGPEHHLTATSLSNVGSCLNTLGRPDEAMPLFRKSLLIHERELGKDHPEVAQAHNNLAVSMQALGKLAEALPLLRRALAIQEKVLGQEHPHTSGTYHNLAVCLAEQGRAAEALPLFRQAMQLQQKVLGKEHPSSVRSCTDLAECLRETGKTAEALTLYRQALRSLEGVLGKDRPETALCYIGLASCLVDQGKAAEALPWFRKASRVREGALGKSHPLTAESSNNLASCLMAQGKLEEALPLLQDACRIRERALGRDHPHTAQSYNNVASCLWGMGRSNEAIFLWQRSLHDQESARAARARSGFDRAQDTRGYSTRSALAVGLAQSKQPRNAFAHAEASLARGLLDDLSPLTPAEAERYRKLAQERLTLESSLAAFERGTELSGAQRARRDAIRADYARISQESSDLRAGASARAVLPLGRIQKAIPPDAALVLWIEEMPQRWACVVRRSGAPVWQELGKSGEGTRADAICQTLIDPGSARRLREKHLAAFRKERLDPLRPHLKGVRTLFVVPTGAFAYVPAELLADDFAIRYVPSGSILARTAENHRPLGTSSLLAVGDPTFDRAPPAEPPTFGVLVQAVLPNTSASRAGIEPGDVLLSVGKTKLESADDLQAALSDRPAVAEVWREGKTFPARVQGPSLGAVLDKRSARAAVRAWRREREAARRGTGHKRLPGTRIEVEAVSSMFEQRTALFGGDASEQKLDELLDTGELKKYRVLHIATHGEANDQIPRLSALILAQDRLPDPADQVKREKHPYDGRLTVSRIRERWKLDADLVVLSACETALGKDAKGDGLLGFAQAFLGVGARSVVLSRWKVDDTATSLLMIRFYENLLGKREGEKAMGRAASLDEAKKWLRTLTRKEAERLATLHTGGVLRGSEGTEKTPDKARPVALKGDWPFEHPYYWAAWALIGDPD